MGGLEVRHLFAPFFPVSRMFPPGCPPPVFQVEGGWASLVACLTFFLPDSPPRRSLSGRALALPSTVGARRIFPALFSAFSSKLSTRDPLCGRAPWLVMVDDCCVSFVLFFFFFLKIVFPSLFYFFWRFLLRRSARGFPGSLLLFAGFVHAASPLGFCPGRRPFVLRLSLRRPSRAFFRSLLHRRGSAANLPSLFLRFVTPSFFFTDVGADRL